MSESSILGLAELNKKLAKLGPELEKKALRAATSRAGTIMLNFIRANAPVGKHSVNKTTYKGNVKYPGFLKRHIAKRSQFKDGIASVIIGVKKEAFYGVQFLEKGTGRSGPIFEGWFSESFLRSEDKAIEAFKKKCNEVIEKIRLSK